MDYSELHKIVSNRRNLHSLFFHSDDNFSSKSRINQILRYVRDPYKSEVAERFTPILSMINHILKILVGRGRRRGKTFRILQKHLRGQTARRIFLSGGCAGYVIGRYFYFLFFIFFKFLDFFSEFFILLFSSQIFYLRRC